MRDRGRGDFDGRGGNILHVCTKFNPGSKLGVFYSN